MKPLRRNTNDTLRPLARDELEAGKVLAEYEKAHSFERVLADALAAAVMSGEEDLEEGVLASIRKHAVRAELRAAPVEPDTAPPDVLIIPAEGEGDEVIGKTSPRSRKNSARTRWRPISSSRAKRCAAGRCHRQRPRHRLPRSSQ